MSPTVRLCYRYITSALGLRIFWPLDFCCTECTFPYLTFNFIFLIFYWNTTKIIHLSNLNFITNTHGSHYMSLIQDLRVHTNIHDTVSENRDVHWNNSMAFHSTIHYHEYIPISALTAEGCNLNATPSSTTVLPGTAPLRNFDKWIWKNPSGHTSESIYILNTQNTYSWLALS
jgi:hypothetical protein